MKEKIKLVLLIGSGRSGSTLTDRIVNLDDEIFGVGELLNFNTSIFKEYCSCGERVESCEYWSKLISRLKWKYEDFEEFKRYQAMYEYPQKGSVFKTKDYSQHGDFESYLSKNYELFHSISELNGEKIIFDSSKSPQRAFNLSQSKFFDVKIIYLMRDPRGVVWSMKKSFRKDLKAGLQKDMKGKSLLKSIYSWISLNSRSFSAIKSMDASTLFVKYEEFCKSPDLQIERILQFIFDGKYDRSIDLDTASSVPNHTIAGNRLRMQKDIVIRPDTDWKKNLSVFQKTFVYLLTFPLINKFMASLK